MTRLKCILRRLECCNVYLEAPSGFGGRGDMPCAPFESVLLNAASASLARNAIPFFLYGCAWKKEQTAELVHRALTAGFRGLDVAAQPKHYREDLAGEGVRRALADGVCRREDLFDLNDMPYDAALPLAEQVRASLASSLRNLRTADGDGGDGAQGAEAYIDSVVLHSPLRTPAATLEAWRELEAHVPRRVRHLGVSNVSLAQLEALWEGATIKPAVVQNRFHAETRFDGAVRAFCHRHSIIYQSFWTLTANPRLLRHASVARAAAGAGVEPAAALYALVMALGDTVVCNGTRSHMRADLEAMDKVKRWAEGDREAWDAQVAQFKAAIGD